MVDGKWFSDLKDRLRQCAALDDLPAPFRPLIAQIEEKVAPFSGGEVGNCLAAARWCSEHGLVQQGLTILQEGIVTLICSRFNLDWHKLDDRELVGSAILMLGRKKPREEWRGALKERADLGARIMEEPLVAGLAPIYDSLSQNRNDINHGGFLDCRDEKTLRKNFEECLRQVEDLFAEFG